MVDERRSESRDFIWRSPYPPRGGLRGPSLRSEGEGALHGRREILLALGVLAILTGSSSGAAALVDDFETDFWLPYTDFLLGDKASAGYSSTYVRSGMRSYHVDVSGYSILDFGSAYGYAVYATRGAAVTELRVSLLYDHLQDASVSSWDAYASGVALDLRRWLHGRHRCGRRGRGRTQRLGRGDASVRDVGHLRLHAHGGSGRRDGHNRRPCAARGRPCPMGRDRDGDRSSQAERSLGRSQPARSTRISLPVAVGSGLPRARGRDPRARERSRRPRTGHVPGK